MDYRPCPELCGGYAAMRIPTATEGRGWRRPSYSAPVKTMSRRSLENLAGYSGSCCSECRNFGKQTLFGGGIRDELALSGDLAYIVA